MQTLGIINLSFGALFMLCYMFQVAYMFIPFVKKMPPHGEARLHKFAVLICARNEENVISELIESIREQDYPAELIDTILVADNCTDNTADVARALGVRVYERFNCEEIGKGYALNYLLSCIDRDFGEDFYDAFIVFDADNVLEKNYVTEVNKTFSDGYEVVTCYRNSKNYGDSWLSAGSGLWFLRESKYLNGSRMRIGACPQISGTGFLFSNSIKKEYGGWPFHTLTEDYEFTCHSVIRGKKFGYSESAVFYDSQVSTFRQAWNQRLRWCKGGLQSFSKYLPSLVGGMLSKKFVACYDMAMSLAPAYIISAVAVIVNAVYGVVLITRRTPAIEVITPLIAVILGAYVVILTQSILTTLTEWRRIKASPFKKVLYIFTFPIYLLTFFPIAVVATFKRNVKWKEIKH